MLTLVQVLYVLEHFLIRLFNIAVQFVYDLCILLGLLSGYINVNIGPGSICARALSYKVV